MQARLSKLPQLPPELAGDGEGDEEEESADSIGALPSSSRSMPPPKYILPSLMTKYYYNTEFGLRKQDKQTNTPNPEPSLHAPLCILLLRPSDADLRSRITPRHARLLYTA